MSALAIASLIGGAISAGAQIFGGVSASKAMRSVQNNLQSQQRDNEAWYDRRYNEDATQRADAQRLLEITNENIKRRNKAAAGTAAVMGGTEESVAATKAANAQTMADAVSQIAASGDRRKDAVEEQYMQNKSALAGQLNQMEVNKANAVTQAAGGVASAAGNAGSAIDESILKKQQS